MSKSKKQFREGFMNNYRPGMPVTEMIFKDLFFALQRLQNKYRNREPLKEILCYPEFPSRNSTFYKICNHLHINITNRPDAKHQLAIYWVDSTYREPDRTIKEMAKRMKVINLQSVDISKTTVDQFHEDVFGYSTRVDPLTYQGFCVQKSNTNAAHDGQVVQCPVKYPKPDCIYQKLVDNKYNDKLVRDIRVPIFGQTIPLTYYKYKPIDSRFANFRTTNDMKRPELYSPEEVFSARELANIKALAGRMQIEFGEMDILRDQNNQKIYVVDVNNTPTGPSHLPKQLLNKAISSIATSFKKEFL